MTSITSASGASYVKVDVDEKATIDEIATAAGISGPGINYYEVQKKEDVSAAKAMLLYVAPSAQWIDGDAARSKLGLAGAKAAVTPALVATKAGAGSKLWVQSTSSNRALPEGSSLIKAVAGGAGAGAGAGKSGSAAVAKPTKAKAASKRKASAADDDEEEEEEEKPKKSKTVAATKARKRAEAKEEEEGGDEDDEEGGELDGEQTFESHQSSTARYAQLARDSFLRQSDAGRWTAKSGQQYIVRAASACVDFEGVARKWPRAWVGQDTQPVMVAMFAVGSGNGSGIGSGRPVLAIAWLFGMDETGQAYLPQFEADAAEAQDAFGDGDPAGLEAIGIPGGASDFFCVSSGCDAVDNFSCPALEGLTIAQVEQGLKGAATAAAPAAAARGTKSTKAAAAAASSAPAAATAGGSSNNGNINIVGKSGSAYVLIPVTEKAPVDEVCAAAGIACNTGFYEVGGKKEDVSAQKELVLLTVPAASAVGSSVNDDYASIRQILGMGAGKASINAATVKAKAGPHARLFVQSTSGNRGILAGTLLCVKTDYGFGGGGAGAGGAVAAGAPGGPTSLASIFAAHYSGAAGVAAAPTPAPAQKRAAAAAKQAAPKGKGKKKAEEDEDEDMEGEGGDEDDDEDDEDPEKALAKHTVRCTRDAASARAAYLSRTSCVLWTSKRGRRFIIRAPSKLVDFEAALPAWPRAFVNEESQLVMAGMWALPPGDGAPVLASLWVFSMGGDETGHVLLKEYQDDAFEVAELTECCNEDGTEKLGLPRDCADAFSVSSGDDTVESFNCPALDSLSLQQVSTGRLAAMAPGSSSGGGFSMPSAAAPRNDRARGGRRGGDDDEGEEGGEGDEDDDGGEDGPGAPGGPGGAAGGAFNKYMLVLPVIRWSGLLSEEFEGDGSTLFPAGSPWALQQADGSVCPQVCDEPPPRRSVAKVKEMLRQIRALGFAKAAPIGGLAGVEGAPGPAAAASAAAAPAPGKRGAGAARGKKGAAAETNSTLADPTEGWFRDARLEARLLAAAHQSPGGACDADIRAWVHSSSPSGTALIVVDLRDEISSTVLLATHGPEFVVVGCVGAHPFLVANWLGYQNSDGSGPDLVTRQASIDAGYMEAGAVATDLESPEALCALTEKFFGEFAEDQHH